ncbi:hypothetical protein CDAR_209491 [Caerostris darwini]|uniref:Uncharacterized protein n=1 Tax=Caerostris darwini TaxID=1538125 RepID=A0AAV4SY31_9ARAC|nr:hypothetical protein CDAR_209491 [Caerostris darwini]
MGEGRDLPYCGIRFNLHIQVMYSRERVEGCFHPVRFLSPLCPFVRGDSRRPPSPPRGMSDEMGRIKPDNTERCHKKACRGIPPGPLPSYL